MNANNESESALIWQCESQVRQAMMELVLKIKQSNANVRFQNLMALQTELNCDSVDTVLRVLRYLEEYHEIQTLYTDKGIFLLPYFSDDDMDQL